MENTKGPGACQLRAHRLTKHMGHAQCLSVPLLRVICHPDVQVTSPAWCICYQTAAPAGLTSCAQSAVGTLPSPHDLTGTTPSQPLLSWPPTACPALLLPWLSVECWAPGLRGCASHRGGGGRRTRSPLPRSCSPRLPSTFLTHLEWNYLLPHGFRAPSVLRKTYHSHSLSYDCLGK